VTTPLDSAERFGVRTRIALAALATAVVVGVGLQCWNQIARTLGAPLEFALDINGTRFGLPRPSGGTATIRGYSVDTVNLELTHVSTQLQWMIGFNIVLQFLLVAVVLLVAGFVWIRTSSGRPFARGVTAALVTLAVTVAVVGTGVELLGSLISLREAQEVLGSHDNSTYFYSGGISVSGLGIGIGLLIGLLATAFGVGSRISRQRARLLRENVLLKRETEGLV
jgi:hypothetical protein